MNVFLIGLRGTGKTTVAQLLSERMGWPWFDADVEVEARAGKSIARIFADDGEPAFREWERQIVAELAAKDQAILALGGGAILRPDNRAAIARSGPAVWLTASPETLWRRISGDAHTAGRRPNLSGGGLEELAATLATRRRALYRQCAACEIDTEEKSPGEVVEAILRQLELGPG